MAQGVGNTLAGLIGGLPMTSVIVRSSVNITVGAKTKLSAIMHDVLSMIRDFKNNRGPAKKVSVSSRGFRDEYKLRDEIQFADYTTRELQDRLTPEHVLEILQEGNRRFRSGNRLTRDLGRQVGAMYDVKSGEISFMHEDKSAAVAG